MSANPLQTENQLFVSINAPSKVERVLFCFPHAGGGASTFYDWRDKIEGNTQVFALQLPGRESRFGEPLLSNLSEVIELIGAEFHRNGERAPFIFYGHSLGALIAFELCRVFREVGEPLPQHLIVTGASTPHLHYKKQPLSNKPEEELLRKIRDFGGMPASILQDRTLLELLLPILRADLSVFESFQYDEEAPLPIEITAIAGEQDESAPVEEVEAWKAHTAKPFTFHKMRGGHFFVKENLGEIIECINSILKKSC